MNQNHEHAFLYYRSPEDIRNQDFSHRMRGVDADEVYEFLDLLADQVSSSEVERSATLRENERLSRENEQYRQETERLRAELRAAQQRQPSAPQGRSAADAEALLIQAQQVADQVVKEAAQRARELVASARNQVRHPESDRARASRADPGTQKAPAPGGEARTDAERDRWRDLGGGTRKDSGYDWGIPIAPPPPPPPVSTPEYGAAASSEYGTSQPAPPSRHDEAPPAPPSRGVERTFVYRRRTSD